MKVVLKSVVRSGQSSRGNSSPGSAILSQIVLLLSLIAKVSEFCLINVSICSDEPFQTSCATNATRKGSRFLFLMGVLHMTCFYFVGLITSKCASFTDCKLCGPLIFGQLISKMWKWWSFKAPLAWRVEKTVAWSWWYRCSAENHCAPCLHHSCCSCWCSYIPHKNLCRTTKHSHKCMLQQ